VPTTRVAESDGARLTTKGPRAMKLRRRRGETSRSIEEEKKIGGVGEEGVRYLRKKKQGEEKEKKKNKKEEEITSDEERKKGVEGTTRKPM